MSALPPPLPCPPPPLPGRSPLLVAELAAATAMIEAGIDELRAFELVADVTDAALGAARRLMLGGQL
jgi:hypothetical protein